MVELDDNNSASNGHYTNDNRVRALDKDRDINEAEEVDVEAKFLENGIKAETFQSAETKSTKANGKKKSEKSEYDRTMTEDINKLLAAMPLAEDTTCGFWFFRGKFFQKFANQAAYVVLYGLVGCIFSMTFAYFNGTITTIEKRFKIPSRNTGFISTGNDISQVLVSAVLSYYAGKGHRPRWIGFGLLTIVAFCLLTASPHFLYGPGEDALALTEEFGAVLDMNATKDIIEQQKTKSLCRLNGDILCEEGEGNLAPQVVLFLAQFISGIGGSLYYTLGIAYMDDNTKKSKTPALLSLSYFLRMLGPAGGYALASLCLRVYIAPQLRPVITMADPRWMGAWWMGWLVLGGLLLFSGVFLTMFPKELPRALARRMVEAERRKQRLAAMREKQQQEQAKNGNEKLEKQSLNMALENGVNRDAVAEENENVETKASFEDMLRTFRRLISNKTLMYNTFSSVFYLFGYTPYWIFTPKYIEMQYRQSAATSSMVTGTVALAFSAVGVLLSGLVISRYKPRARSMAAWNVLVGFLTVLGILAYAFVGCPGNEKSVIVNIHDSSLDNSTTCNSACQCDYVRYSPVCGENGMTYISPCHAGCKKQYMDVNGKKIFYECACIPSTNSSANNAATFVKHTAMDLKIENDNKDNKNQRTMADSMASMTNLALLKDYEFPPEGQAVTGACPVDCFAQFVTFLAVMCCLKFVGATGRATNFLVTVRCVPEKDKTAAMGFGMMMMSMLALIPSPIFFGWLLDRLCLVWGKTCTNKGNCWLYDPESVRYTLNFTAAVLIAIGTVFDGGVWYYVKDLKIFDEEVKDIEMEIVQRQEESKPEKNTEI